MQGKDDPEVLLHFEEFALWGAVSIHSPGLRRAHFPPASLFEEQFGHVGPVLHGDAGDQCLVHQG